MAIGNSKAFTALINAAADGVLVINKLGIIERLNPGITRLFGYSREELMGRNVSVLMPASLREAHDGYLQRYLLTGETNIIGQGREVIGRRKDGSEFPLYLSVGVVDSEEAVNFVGILHDLTHEKLKAEELSAAEREIRLLISRLAHAARISTMGEMAASIAHEVNQPLTAIASYAQTCRRMLDQETPDIAKVAETLEKIDNQAIRAGGIVSSMRDWVRQTDMKREAHNCNDLIKGIEDIAGVDAREHGVSLRFELAAALPGAMVDAVQIQQVALNLIHNAAEAMAECGSPRADQPIAVTTQSPDAETIKVSVADRGPGIAEGIRESLFTPFFTTKATGTGMGLSICRTIIDAHGGSLEVEPNPGGGTVFSFTLPTSVESQT